MAAQSQYRLLVFSVFLPIPQPELHHQEVSAGKHTAQYKDSVEEGHNGTLEAAGLKEQSQCLLVTEALGNEHRPLWGEQEIHQEEEDDPQPQQSTAAQAKLRRQEGGQRAVAVAVGLEVVRFELASQPA